jgi:cobalt-zinc-cadmium efflux system membrane fusion protein
MKHQPLQAAIACVALATLALSTGCKKQGPADPAAEAPPKVTVEHTGDVNFVHVQHPAQFALVPATAMQTTTSLNVTGTVNPDISQTIPVISIANGRVLDVHARLGDYVHKGQLLMDVQSTDVSGAFATYLKAVNDERLTKIQLDRATLLYGKGAIPKSQLEIAENGEQDNLSDLTAAEEQLKVLGVDKDHPAAAVHIKSPANGVIIAQNVTNASAAGVGLAGSSTAFTIADLSHVWIICDVYENDLAQVHLGQKADIHLNALPGQTLTGTISDIGAILDPSIRTAKVRLQVQNPNMLMRVGEFVTATFHGTKLATHTMVPADAVLHLQDKDWVYLPAENGEFHRIEVQTGPIVNDASGKSLQEITAGLQPGQQVVATALSLQNEASQ